MGSYLSQPVTDKETDDGDRWGYSCMQGWRVDMEDAHICISDLDGTLKGVGLFSVFDGHGGAEVAKFCSKYVSAKFKELHQPNDLPGSLAIVYEAIDDMLRTPVYQAELSTLKKRNLGEVPGSAEALAELQASISEDLRELRTRPGGVSREDASHIMVKMVNLRRLEQSMTSQGEALANADNVGCTAVTTVITETSIIVANSGDSRAVLCRGGIAIPLSRDHKPNLEIERSRIEAAGCRVEEVAGGARTHYRVNGNLNLSRAIGDLEYKKRADLPASAQAITCTPEIRVEARKIEDEFLIIACDGIWDVLTDEEAVEFVRARMGKISLSQICSEMLDKCLTPDPKETSGLGADNMTCIVVSLNSVIQ